MEHSQARADFADDSRRCRMSTNRDAMYGGLYKRDNTETPYENCGQFSIDVSTEGRQTLLPYKFNQVTLQYGLSHGCNKK